MNQDYFDKIANLFKEAQEPFRAMAELNVKTLQSFAYLKPDDFSKITKPNELIEKQLEMVVSNGQKALDYLQKSFQIMEKAMASFTHHAKDTMQDK